MADESLFGPTAAERVKMARLREPVLAMAGSRSVGGPSHSSSGAAAARPQPTKDTGAPVVLASTEFEHIKVGIPQCSGYSCYT